jgi:peptide-methionine (S)-S-oxide reductase
MINNIVVSLGDFWEAEDFFMKVPGVTHTEVGYSGGTVSKPGYHTKGDHTDVVKIEFDPRVISHEELLSLVCEYCVSYKIKTHPIIYYIDNKELDDLEDWQNEFKFIYPESVNIDFQPLNKYHPAERYHQKHLAKLRGDLVEQAA